MHMNILVVGGGGREHAITTALIRNNSVSVYSVMAKKNPGIAAEAAGFLLEKETHIDRIVEYAVVSRVDYAIIGPEAPLEAGIVDALELQGIGCLGPTRAAARIETDKAFCRELMREHGIAGTPLYRIFHSPDDACHFISDHEGDLAVKPIGLTGGKGVRITGEHFTHEGACEYVRSIGGDVVIEERLIGEEFTLMAFSDGVRLIPMPLVQDHKRAYNGDIGPNTGGMGSYSMPDHRMPFVTDRDYTCALSIMEDVMEALRKEGSPFRGILYGQFMNTSGGPKVIEFNARFGDPEAMNVLSILSSDFAAIVEDTANGRLGSTPISFENQATVCKYIVPEGYPDAPRSGGTIEIRDHGDALLYYSNVVEENGRLVNQTSRTLAFVGKGDTLEDAERIAESAALSVRGSVRHRSDIGTQEVLERRCAHMREIR